MIFPGMDPYLENPGLWPGFHNRLVVYLADQLQSRIDPRYVASVEERVYVQKTERDIIPDVWVRFHRDVPFEGGGVAVAEDEAPVLVDVPDLEIHENSIAILDRESGEKVVTVIEVVSPANKYAGPGRVSYLEKQSEVRSSDAHLVEIDLLRAGPHVVAVAEYAARGRGRYDYLVSVNRARGSRSQFELYPRTVRHRLPNILVPLAGDDPDARLDLGASVAQAYEAGRYRARIDYAKPCVPPLRPEDQAWADALIREATPRPDPS